ncbi:hypothetical protein N7488_007771 [Penicillium malachiteum]|nr:hypothetical protein N7488_007771 [Penicillium malachiteum]
MDSYYSEKTGFDQSRHELSRSMRSLNRQELDRSNTCVSPSADIDAKLRSNTQRRRVPVACHRCRKRKIKCSGDAGDGQGCSNCRSSGSKDCQFFRVKAHNLDDKEITAHHKAKGWDPYLNMGVAAPQLGMSISHTQHKAALASMRSPTHHAAFQRTPDYDLNPADAHVFQRSGIANAIPYEDEPPVNFSQSSQYMLPNAPGVMTEYGSPAWAKSWDSVFNTGRTSNGGMYPELQNASMNQPQFAYMLPSQGHSLSEMPSSTNAAMSAVSSPDVSGSDRTLRTPTSRNQGPASLGYLPTEGNPNMSWSPADFKGDFKRDFKGALWSPRVATSIGSPPQTIPSNVPFTSSPELLSKGVSMNVNAPDLVFTYPTTSEDSNAALLCSSSVSSAALLSTTSRVTPTYPILGALDTTPEYSSIPSDIKPIRKSSRDHTSGQRLHALTNECTSDIYGYSSSAKRKARGGSDPDTRTLVSGLPYTRVQHRDSPGTNFPFNLLPEALPEYHRAVVENVHRPPVEPLGNQGAY